MERTARQRDGDVAVAKTVVEEGGARFARALVMALALPAMGEVSRSAGCCRVSRAPRPAN
jgi:hypothetical protein